jgi:isopentenyldiphosphate isomerase
MDYVWVSLQDFMQDLRNNPKKYTVWLPQALDLVKKSHPYIFAT